MLLQLYASVTARLQSFVSSANEADSVVMVFLRGVLAILLGVFATITAGLGVIWKVLFVDEPSPFWTTAVCLALWAVIMVSKFHISRGEIADDDRVVFVALSLETAWVCGVAFLYVVRAIRTFKASYAIRTFLYVVRAIRTFKVSCARISANVTALLAMLLDLYASARLELFVSSANEAGGISVVFLRGLLAILRGVFATITAVHRIIWKVLFVGDPSPFWPTAGCLALLAVIMDSKFHISGVEIADDERVLCVALSIVTIWVCGVAFPYVVPAIRTFKASCARISVNVTFLKHCLWEFLWELALAKVHSESAKFFLHIVVDDTTALICGIMVSQICSAVITYPFHYVKIRMQNGQSDVEGMSPSYTTYEDCGLKILEEEGPFAFYTGFLTHCARIIHRILILCSILRMLV